MGGKLTLANFLREKREEKNRRKQKKKRGPLGCGGEEHVEPHVGVLPFGRYVFFFCHLVPFLVGWQNWKPTQKLTSFGVHPF